MREFEVCAIRDNETRGPRKAIQGDDPFHAAELAVQRFRDEPVRAIEVYECGARVLTWIIPRRAAKGQAARP